MNGQQEGHRCWPVWDWCSDVLLPWPRNCICLYVVACGRGVTVRAADGKPAGQLSITTEALPNGTIATTTITTDANGSVTKNVQLVDPYSDAPVPAIATGAPAAGPGPMDDAVGPASVDAAAVGPAAADAPSASALAVGAAGEILGDEPPPPATPDSPVYVYASAVDAITGGMFRSRRRRALLGAAQGGLRMGSRGAPLPGHPGTSTPAIPVAVLALCYASAYTAHRHRPLQCPAGTQLNARTVSAAARLRRGCMHVSWSRRVRLGVPPPPLLSAAHACVQRQNRVCLQAPWIARGPVRPARLPWACRRWLPVSRRRSSSPCGSPCNPPPPPAALLTSPPWSPPPHACLYITMSASRARHVAKPSRP